jgi:hypothetical protein
VNEGDGQPFGDKLGLARSRDPAGTIAVRRLNRFRAMACDDVIGEVANSIQRLRVRRKNWNMPTRI